MTQADAMCPSTLQVMQQQQQQQQLLLHCGLSVNTGQQLDIVTVKLHCTDSVGKALPAVFGT